MLKYFFGDSFPLRLEIIGIQVLRWLRQLRWIDSVPVQFIHFLDVLVHPYLVTNYILDP